MCTGQAQEFCQADVYSAQCPESHVIVMKSAFYGRMRLGRCVRGDYGYLGCAQDELDLMDSKCSGAAACRFRVFDSGLGLNSRCPADIASYLEASYDCQPGALHLTRNSLLIGIPSPTHSFFPGVKPSFAAKPAHAPQPFLCFFRILYMDSPRLFTVTSEHIPSFTF